MRSPARSERGRTARRHPGADRGQAAVELALCLPLVCLVALAVVQVGVVVHDRMVVVAAAREGARAAAVSAAPAAAAAAAMPSTGSPPLRVRTASDGSTVTVTVSTTDRTDVPLIGLLLPDVHLEASATMQLEPP